MRSVRWRRQIGLATGRIWREEDFFLETNKLKIHIAIPDFKR
jgi:hypothetical protein